MGRGLMVRGISRLLCSDTLKLVVFLLLVVLVLYGGCSCFGKLLYFMLASLQMCMWTFVTNTLYCPPIHL